MLGLSATVRKIRAMPRLVERLSLATLVMNTVIVVTGGAVRLTDSGLGCPTWPRCSADSYTNTHAMGIHGYIEFGNRTLTFVLGMVIGLTIIAVAIQRRQLLWLAVAQFFGVAAQGIIGGITVLTGLNPWVVGGHFLVSMLMIYGALALWCRSSEGDQPRKFVLAMPLVWLVRAIATAAGIVLILGTIVTGSGPHSGDEKAARNGFDPESISQLHTDGVFLLIGLSIASLLALRAVKAPAIAQRVAITLVIVELAQGAVGFTQYFTGLPVILVGMHLLGACLVWIYALRLLFAARIREIQNAQESFFSADNWSTTDREKSSVDSLA